MESEDQFNQVLRFLFGVEIGAVLENCVEAVVNLKIEVKVLDKDHLGNAYFLRILLYFLGN